MSIKGFKSQQALSKKLGGYTEDQSIDQARYVTVQEMSGKRHALDVIIQGAYQIGTLPSTIGAGSNIRVIKCVAHGANKNDIIRLSNGTQFSVISIPDADTIITSVELDVDPTGDTFTIWRHITPSYNADGSLNVLASQAPIKFNKDGVATTVNYDTVTPSSSEALPVNIVTVNGQGIATTVDLSGAQINVQLSDRGSSPDSVQIGDGTTIVGVDAPTSSLKTYDIATNNTLIDVQADTSAMSTYLSNIDSRDNDFPFSGSVTSSTPLVVDIQSKGTLTFDVTGTWVGSIIVEASLDGTTYRPTTYNALTSGNSSTTFSANTTGQINTVGIDFIRFRSNTISSGTANFVTLSSRLVANIMLDNSLPTGANVIGSINNITGTITLPTLASTSTLQTTGNSSLSSIDTKTPALGQALAAASTPVVLTAIQVAALTPPAAITGFALEAGHLATIDTKTPALGQALAAASTPVVLTAIQVAALTPPAAITGFNLETTQTAMSAKLPASLGIKTASASLSVAPASDAVFSIKQKAITGSFAEVTALTTVQTFTAPANAIGAKIMADDTNAANVRFKQGAAATATSGLQLQAGRSEDLGNGTDISVCAESGTLKVMVIWNIQA